MNTHDPKRQPGETQEQYRVRQRQSKAIAKTAMTGFNLEKGQRINPARAAKRLGVTHRQAKRARMAPLRAARAA